jgi:hypothetical protein
MGLPIKVVVTTNMDASGMETHQIWKESKNFQICGIIRVKYSDHLISDLYWAQDYFKEKYNPYRLIFMVQIHIF